MRPRRFVAGQTMTVGCVPFRVATGRKTRGDLRLDWRVDGTFVPVELPAVFLIVDFVSENEDVLYPHPNRGGEELLRYLKIARIDGWQRAVDMLHLARVRKGYDNEFGNEVDE